MDTYFRYYTDQIAFFTVGKEDWAKTHQDILEIVAILRKDLKRDEVRQKLLAKMPRSHSNGSDESLDCSIDLAIRLLLMMKVGHLPNYYSPYKELLWEQGPTLREFVAKTFASRGTFASERVKLDKFFTARNLSRLAGMKICWTNNLADHLRILDEDTEVAIFHHASFLEAVKLRYSKSLYIYRRLVY